MTQRELKQAFREHSEGTQKIEQSDFVIPSEPKILCLGWLSILYLIIQHCLQLIVKYKTNINFQHWTTSSAWLHKICTYPHVRSKLYGVKIDFYQNGLGGGADSNYLLKIFQVGE